jgi:hypothetical protein
MVVRLVGFGTKMISQARTISNLVRVPAISFEEGEISSFRNMAFITLWAVKRIQELGNPEWCNDCLVYMLWHCKCTANKYETEIFPKETDHWRHSKMPEEFNATFYCFRRTSMIIVTCWWFYETAVAFGHNSISSLTECGVPQNLQTKFWWTVFFYLHQSLLTYQELRGNIFGWQDEMTNIYLSELSAHIAPAAQCAFFRKFYSTDVEDWLDAHPLKGILFSRLGI